MAFEALAAPSRAGVQQGGGGRRRCRLGDESGDREMAPWGRMGRAHWGGGDRGEKSDSVPTTGALEPQEDRQEGGGQRGGQRGSGRFRGNSRKWVLVCRPDLGASVWGGRREAAAGPVVPVSDGDRGGRVVLSSGVRGWGEVWGPEGDAPEKGDGEAGERDGRWRGGPPRKGDRTDDGQRHGRVAVR